MTEPDRKLSKKAVIRGWAGTAAEILKWAFVAWLLWPIAELGKHRLSVGRVVAGICLFVVFAGKLFYDTLITEFVRQRRTSAKQDLVALLGMIGAMLLLAGIVAVMTGLLILQWQREAGAGMNP